MQLVEKRMKVFISWSGRTSLLVAQALHKWLPYVIQQAQPYVSAEDIRKGNRWGVDIAQQLEQAHHGIVCLTRDNLDAPWILFEAGALSKSIEMASVWTLLIGGLTPADIQGPLAQFQHTSFVKEDFRKMIYAINDRMGSGAIDEQTLGHIFEKFWPDLEEEVQGIIRTTPGTDEPPEVRTTEAVLSELLDLSRSMSKSLAVFNADEPRLFHERHNFRTEVAIVPVRDEALIDDYRSRCVADPDIRRAGLVGSGAGGLGIEDSGTEYNRVHFQSYHPIPKEPLLRHATEAGIEVIDVRYERLVFKKE